MNGFKIADQPNAGLEDGVWAPYEGSEFKIAHSSNVRFLRTKQRLEQPHRRKIEAGNFDPAEQRRLLVKAMAEAILLDWKGVANSEGQPVEYSTKLAEQALTNDDQFRDFVMEFSINSQNFREAELEHEGNS